MLYFLSQISHWISFKFQDSSLPKEDGRSNPPCPVQPSTAVFMSSRLLWALGDSIPAELGLRDCAERCQLLNFLWGGFFTEQRFFMVFPSKSQDTLTLHTVLGSIAFYQGVDIPLKPTGSPYLLGTWNKRAGINIKQDSKASAPKQTVSDARLQRRFPQSNIRCSDSAFPTTKGCGDVVTGQLGTVPKRCLIVSIS